MNKSRTDHEQEWEQKFLKSSSMVKAKQKYVCLR